MESEIDPKDVDRILFAVRMLVTGNTEWFMRVGEALDEEYSHEEAWLREVQKVSGWRVGTLEPFTEQEIDRERGRLASGGDPEEEFARARRNDLLEMPRWDQTRFSSVRARGRHAVEALVEEVLAPKSTTPRIDACAQLVLLTWAFLDQEARHGGRVLTVFQTWREGYADLVSGTIDQWDLETPADDWLLAADRAMGVLELTGAVGAAKKTRTRKQLPAPTEESLAAILAALKGKSGKTQVGIEQVMEGFGLGAVSQKKFLNSRYVTRAGRTEHAYQLPRKASRRHGKGGRFVSAERAWSATEVRKAVRGWREHLKNGLS